MSATDKDDLIKCYSVNDEEYSSSYDSILDYLYSEADIGDRVEYYEAMFCQAGHKDYLRLRDIENLLESIRESCLEDIDPCGETEYLKDYINDDNKLNSLMECILNHLNNNAPQPDILKCVSKPIKVSGFWEGEQIRPESNTST